MLTDYDIVYIDIGGNSMFQKTFIQAIHSKNKLSVSFFSKEDGRVIVRTCAPMDFGPSRQARVKRDKYHLWDYDSDTGSHVLSLNPDQLSKIEILSEIFEPREFITWDVKKSPWFIKRDWGKYS